MHCGVVEREEAALELLVAHEQLAKAVEPTVANLDHPAPRLLGWIAPLGISLRASTDDMRNVAVRLDDFQCTPTSVSGVSTQVLTAPRRWGIASDHDGLQHWVELRNVMLIGPGHDERQRDATAVHQQVPLAAFFFPDQLGCARPPLAPRAL